MGDWADGWMKRELGGWSLSSVKIVVLFWDCCYQQATTTTPSLLAPAHSIQ